MPFAVQLIKGTDGQLADMSKRIDELYASRASALAGDEMKAHDVLFDKSLGASCEERRGRVDISCANGTSPNTRCLTKLRNSPSRRAVVEARTATGLLLRVPGNVEDLMEPAPTNTQSNQTAKLAVKESSCGGPDSGQDCC